MPLNVAWHRSGQGCDCACVLCVLDCVGDNRYHEVPVVRDILTMPQQALSPPAELNRMRPGRIFRGDSAHLQG